MKPTVCLQRCAAYEPQQLFQFVAHSFSVCGFIEQIKPGMRVAVKVNLVQASAPEKAAITHPEVTRAVVRYLKSLGADVRIAESPGGVYSPAVMEHFYKATGYTAVAEEEDVPLYTACKSQTVSVNGNVCRQVALLEPFLQADCVVDICKIKTHAMMQYSGAVKNLFGCVPGLQKTELHCRYPDAEHFADMLVDICERIKPTICIADGIAAMEGDGPTGGNPKELGLLGASASPYALDLAFAQILHIPFAQIPTVSAAIRRGLSSQNTADILFTDLSPEEIEDPHFVKPKSSSVDFLRHVPAFLRPAAQKICTPVPVVRKKDCIGCGKCAASCPQKTIRIVQQKAVIRRENCIRCFCCQELCPQHAISIRRFSVFRL